MKLLVLTQKVDARDDVLGFFHEWLRRLAAQCETVEVICLYEGAHDLPANVRVHSLGKEKGAGRLVRVARFYKYIWSLGRDYNSVLVHMNPEYVMLGGVLWRLWHKRIVLWYTHRAVNLKLRIAVALSHVVATAASESLRIKSPKVHVIGHGIDTTRFAAAPLRPLPDAPKIVSVGRLTPIKHLEVILDAVFLLRQRGVPATLTLVGASSVASDRAYETMLRQRAAAHPGVVTFAGPVPYDTMPETYSRYDVAVNACPTGGLDKAVFESMAAGVPTLVANKAFRSYLEPHADELMFAFGNASDLAKKIEALPRAGTQLQEFVRDSARRNGDVSAVVAKLILLLD
jgi:glycosyltransferase involved in cell wall biosynthesis